MRSCDETADALEDRLQQPLTAIRLLIEGGLRGLVETSPEFLGKIMHCIAEMQAILDETAFGRPEQDATGGTCRP